MSLAKLYPHDFDSGNLRDLSHELGLYIHDVRDDDRFSSLQTIAELSQKMVETKKHDLRSSVCLTSRHHSPTNYHLLIYQAQHKCLKQQKQHNTTVWNSRKEPEDLKQTLVFMYMKKAVPFLY